MAIRERVRRALQKSESTSSISQVESHTTTSSSSRSSEPSSSKGSIKESRLTRGFPWSRSSKVGRADDKPAPPTEPSAPVVAKKKRRKGPVHPSERQLTEENLRVQSEYGLVNYNLVFGRTKGRPVSFMSGISPGCSRRPSMDHDGTATPSMPLASPLGLSSLSRPVTRDDSSFISAEGPRVVVDSE